MPLRVFIDTNVLVSAIVFEGVPSRVVDAVREAKLDGFVSLHVLGETREVLTRPRFGYDTYTADSLVEDVATWCEVVPIERTEQSWCLDPDDDPVVEAAILARVDVVVTGDSDLLRLDCAGIRFLTPAQLIELIAQK